MTTKEFNLPFLPLEKLKFATLTDLYTETVKKYPEHGFQMSRIIHEDGTYGEYQTSTYTDFNKKAHSIASKLQSLGITKGDRVGIMACTRAAWTQVDIACQLIGVSVVPFYDTQGQEDLSFICRQSGIKALFMAPNLAWRLSDLLEFGNDLKNVVLFDDQAYDVHHIQPYNDFLDEPLEDIPSSMASGPAIPKTNQPSEDTLECIRRFIDRENTLFTISSRFVSDKAINQPEITPDDEATVIYTSGSTGTPKGVVLTHRNMVFGVNSMCAPVPEHETRIFQLLPFAHVYGRIVEYVAIACHGESAYYSGTPRNFSEDIQAAKPTIMGVVPRLLERIYSSALAKLEKAPLLTRKIFNKAYETQKRRILRGNARSEILDRLIFNKLRQGLGGRLRWMCCGSAPLAAEIQTFVNTAFNIQVTEGYGMTETTALISCNPFDHFEAGTVGLPMPGVKVKLRSIPDSKYTTDQEEPTGEIMVSGDGVFQGYLGFAQEETFVFEDGVKWFPTGDVGKLVKPLGSIRIVDRIKTIHKLANGEFVHIQAIETTYSTSQLISSIYVYGDATRNFLVACIQPDFEYLSRVYPNSFKTSAEVVNDKEIQKLFLEDMDRIATKSLKAYERIRYIVLDYSADWTPEKGLITSSLKVRRGPLKERCTDIFDRFYAVDAAKPDEAKELSKLRPRVRLFEINKRRCGVAIIDKPSALYDGYTTAVSAM